MIGARAALPGVKWGHFRHHRGTEGVSWHPNNTLAISAEDQFAENHREGCFDGVYLIGYWRPENKNAVCVDTSPA